MKVENLDEAATTKKDKLRARGYVLQQQLIALLPKEQDSMKRVDNANQVMKKVFGFLPSAEHLPALSDEEAIGVISKIDAMVDLINALP